MHKVALTIAFLAAFTAPVFAQKVKIEEANAKWIELFNKGDFENIANLYTADAIAFPPGAPMVKGRAAIGKMWKGLADQAANPKLTTLEVRRLSPNVTREIGTFTLVTRGPAPKELSGKYLVLWERSQGRWKLSADIWNEGK